MKKTCIRADWMRPLYNEGMDGVINDEIQSPEGGSPHEVVTAFVDVPVLRH
jgi:hypothetical protein